ncbi:hypothetical protein [Nocardioides sp.]|uniref:hypothetical protein n=1 Tax=Nocardioides sp. TaxID=35761 RepID=UPI002616BF2C|nr:hypothetical protein [Nocardioides sp.]MCW2739385.1 hypothetical protein [Nocardioides sp.]
MPTLLAAVALATAGLLPIPLLPPDDAGAQSPPALEQVEVSGTLQAADGRLRRGCKDYQFTYGVTTASEDWSFDITIQDRHGRGVHAQSLIGPNDPTSGVLTYRLCRWATVPGIFTLTGTLVSYEGADETTATATDTFRLRRRNP